MRTNCFPMAILHSRAKATKRGGYVVFEPKIRQEIEARLALEAELALAVERGEFELFYQPQVDLGSGELIGAEALIRWRHPVRGLVSPGEFIPVDVVDIGEDRGLGIRDRLPASSRVGEGRSCDAGRRQLVAVATSFRRPRKIGRRRAGSDRSYAIVA